MSMFWGYRRVRESALCTVPHVAMRKLTLNSSIPTKQEEQDRCHALHNTAAKLRRSDTLDNRVMVKLQD